LAGEATFPKEALHLKAVPPAFMSLLMARILVYDSGDVQNNDK